MEGISFKDVVAKCAIMLNSNMNYVCFTIGLSLDRFSHCWTHLLIEGYSQIKLNTVTL